MRQIAAVLKKYIRKQTTEAIKAKPESVEELNSQEVKVRLPAEMPPGDPYLIELFIKDASNAIIVLEDFCGKQGEFMDDDFRTYITAAHSMKSALRNIGEEELSAAAAKLEQTGRDNDSAAILLETPSFLGELRAKIDVLSRSVEKVGDKEIKNEDYLFLRNKLCNLKEACSRYDRKTQKTILADLRKDTWSQPIIDALSILNKLSIEGEIEEITALIDKIIRMP